MVTVVFCLFFFNEKIHESTGVVCGLTAEGTVVCLPYSLTDSLRVDLYPVDSVHPAAVGWAKVGLYITG